MERNEIPTYSSVMVLAQANVLELKPNFIIWLCSNWPIWQEFCALAKLMRDRGRHRWSARAVVHVLRWNRAMREVSDDPYAINNDHTPSIARLYNKLYEVDFFTLRESP